MKKNQKTGTTTGAPTTSSAAKTNITKQAPNFVVLLFILVSFSHLISIPLSFLSRRTSIPNPPPPSPPPPPPPPKSPTPYHDYELFQTDFLEMRRRLKIFVYPDVYTNSTTFRPNPNPNDPKLFNYYSEHMFKIALLNSNLLTSNPNDVTFFYLPFSINALRNDPTVRSETRIARFVGDYVVRIGREYEWWNASGGVDHFYVCCHSVGRLAASRHPGLRDYAVQVACSANYFQRMFFAHKDVGLPQIWPRDSLDSPNPPHTRKRLLFFSGRRQNSKVRRELMEMWENDPSMDIFSGGKHLDFPYEQGFKRSRFCLHIKGYEVNTARISDAIHFGCIPVIVSNYYDLPLSSILDWSKFSVIVDHGDIGLLKNILLSIPRFKYLGMYRNLLQVRKHFRWHTVPRDYDAFEMTAYQLWLRRGVSYAHS